MVNLLGRMLSAVLALNCSHLRSDATSTEDCSLQIHKRFSLSKLWGEQELHEVLLWVHKDDIHAVHIEPAPTSIPM